MSDDSLIELSCWSPKLDFSSEKTLSAAADGGWSRKILWAARNQQGNALEFVFHHSSGSCALSLSRGGRVFLIFLGRAMSAGVGFFTRSSSDATSFSSRPLHKCLRLIQNLDHYFYCMGRRVVYPCLSHCTYILGGALLLEALELAAMFYNTCHRLCLCSVFFLFIPVLCPVPCSPHYSHYYAGIFGTSLFVYQSASMSSDVYGLSDLPGDGVFVLIYYRDVVPVYSACCVVQTCSAIADFSVSPFLTTPLCCLTLVDRHRPVSPM